MAIVVAPVVAAEHFGFEQAAKEFTVQKLVPEPAGRRAVSGSFVEHALDMPGERNVLEKMLGKLLLARIEVGLSKQLAGLGQLNVAAFEVGEAEVMVTAVNAVDDRIGAAGQLVLEPAGHKPAHDRLRRAGRMNGERPFTYIMPALAHRTVHRLDDVAAVTEFAETGLEVGLQRPARWACRCGQAQALDTSLEATLKKQGMQFASPDTTAFQKALTQSGFYKTWKGKFGTPLWAALESVTGPLA